MGVMAFLIGGLVAGGIVFLYGYRQIQALWAKKEEEAQRLQADIQLREQRIFEAQQQLSQEQSRCATLEERASRVPPLEDSLAKATLELTQLRARIAELTTGLDHE